jgi:hypothetical protein
MITMRISRQDLLSGIIEAVYSKESKNDNGCFAVDSVLQVNGLGVAPKLACCALDWRDHKITDPTRGYPRFGEGKALISRGDAEKTEMGEIDDITGQIVDLAYKLHTGLGPGLLESVYEAVLARDLERHGFKVVNNYKPSSSAPPRLRVNRQSKEQS